MLEREEFVRVHKAYRSTFLSRREPQPQLAAESGPMEAPDIRMRFRPMLEMYQGDYEVRRDQPKRGHAPPHRPVRPTVRRLWQTPPVAGGAFLRRVRDVRKDRGADDLTCAAADEGTIECSLRSQSI